MEFNCLATAISSLPFKDPVEACDIVFKWLPNIPAWPQLPARGFRENMYVQLSQNLPGIKLDEEEKKISFDTGGDNNRALELFYENVISENTGYFSIGKDYAAGLYEFTGRLKTGKEMAARIKYVKGHVTGPVSFGLTVTDLDRKAIFYNEQYRDVIVKNCAMKAKWQVKFLRKETGIKDVIIFIDEPYMTSFGSSFVSLSREEVINNINEVVEAIHTENAIAGIHCCGNTDWTVLFLTKTDIISFDAYNYIESIILYPEMLTKHFNEGRALAWGIVPSSEEIKIEDKNTLLNKFKTGINSLIRKGLREETIMKNCLITPSCGVGTLDDESARRVMKLNLEVSDALRGAV